MRRSSITLFDDQYDLYKAFKSKKLLVAFVEFMFEDIEPKNLNEKEEKIFNSLRKRMLNSMKKHDGNSKGGGNSHGGGRHGKDSGELENENKSKTSQEQVEIQVKNNEEEEEEEVIKKENISKEKKTYLENVLLTEEEYNKLHDTYDSKVIDEYMNRLNNYVGQHGDKYSSHYLALLTRIRKDRIPKKSKNILNNDTGIGLIQLRK